MLPPCHATLAAAAAERLFAMPIYARVMEVYIERAARQDKQEAKDRCFTYALRVIARCYAANVHQSKALLSRSD